MRNILNNQPIRFALVGVMSNGVAYLAYLLIALLMRPDVAMTVIYVVAFLISFWGNRTFTFKHESGLVPTVFRFTAMHVLLFTIQYSLHGYFVYVLKHPHQAVQAVSTILIGVMSYTISRIFVFRTVVK
jgi:putative flippase GtrA